MPTCFAENFCRADIADKRGTDKAHWYLSAVEAVVGEKAAKLSAVGVSSYGNWHCGKMCRLAALNILSEEYHSRTGAENGEALFYLRFYGFKKSQLSEELALNGALSPGEDKSVERPAYIGELTYLKAFYAKLGQLFFVLRKCALKCKDCYFF